MSQAKISVWINDVQQSPHGDHPLAPQGFYHDPNYGTPDGYDSYWDTYTNDGEQTVDPNLVAHGLELQTYRADPERWPSVYVCAARKGADGEIDIVGMPTQVSWRWDNEGPEPWEFWTHDKSVWEDRIYGGESQRHDNSMPPQEQCYYLGTIYVYIDVTFADFAKHWQKAYPPFDFNTNGIVDIEDLVVFLHELWL
jgi:hypothetical protein